MKASVKQKSKFTRLGIALLFIVAAIVAAALVFSRFGGFGTGPSADTAEFAKYAQPVSEIAIPEKSRIVALGEATHGNREFQELKLDAFKVMVERYGVRAFALEGDFGGCEAANRYIHGGERTDEEAAEALVFTIYRTDQMAGLLSWMREYNDTAAPGDDLRFYGFDMQSFEYSLGYLLEEARGNGRIFISGHNGHIERTGSYGPDAKVMGAILADELGDAYYAIGTDFCEAEVNLPDNGKRITHTFFSYDPLAKAAATNGLEVCWLDFARVPADSPLRACIDEPVMMGSVGEGFIPLMYVLPQTYRIKREPAGIYDSMIFVAHAHPISVKAQ